MMDSSLAPDPLSNDYSYNVSGLGHPGGGGSLINNNPDSQYDFNHVQQGPPPSAYMQRLRTGHPGHGGPGSGLATSAGIDALGAAVSNGAATSAGNRPVTSNRGAGYSAASVQQGIMNSNINGVTNQGNTIGIDGKTKPLNSATFDPLNMGAGGGQPGGETKKQGQGLKLGQENMSPEDRLREDEKQIHALIEQSACIRENGDLNLALERAKEAGKRERALCRQRETQGLLESLNVDLTYSVCLNLALMHEANNNTSEALGIYTQIVKNKQYPYSGRFRVNMGNIFFHQGKYTSAIKNYRMALDQVPNHCQSIRLKISRNIGHAFCKMHQFPDAVDAYAIESYDPGNMSLNNINMYGAGGPQGGQQVQGQGGQVYGQNMQMGGGGQGGQIGPNGQIIGPNGQIIQGPGNIGMSPGGGKGGNTNVNMGNNNMNQQGNNIQMGPGGAQNIQGGGPGGAQVNAYGQTVNNMGMVVGGNPQQQVMGGPGGGAAGGQQHPGGGQMGPGGVPGGPGGNVPGVGGVGLRSRQPGLDYMTGFDLILCYHALGDVEKMKQGFLRLLQIHQAGGGLYLGLEDASGSGFPLGLDEDSLNVDSGGGHGGSGIGNDVTMGGSMMGGIGIGIGGGGGNTSGVNTKSVMDKTEALAEGDDPLREDIKKRQREAQRYIINAATLIAPQIQNQYQNQEMGGGLGGGGKGGGFGSGGQYGGGPGKGVGGKGGGFGSSGGFNNTGSSNTTVHGYDWVIDALNAHNFPGIASEVEISKASYFLKKKEFDEAITVLKQFEKKETTLMARAATNLSFLYFLEGDYASAEKYSDVAVKADRYNSRALVNKGNCLFIAGDLERSKEVYLEAIGVSAECLEAIYNLGLVNSHLGKCQEALLAFEKLHSITHNNIEVMWQLGDLHERLGNLSKAHEWLSLIVTCQHGRPTDPGVLARLANLYSRSEDDLQAFHYNLESHRYWPVDLSVITWLGIYYVKKELYESAIPFFSRAAQIQPNEVKWLLMVASCYRRMGSYHPALKLYEDIHRTYPADTECLRYLITICSEMKQPQSVIDRHTENLTKLQKMEQAMKQQQQQQSSSDPNNINNNNMNLEGSGLDSLSDMQSLAANLGPGSNRKAGGGLAFMSGLNSAGGGLRNNNNNMNSSNLILNNSGADMSPSGNSNQGTGNLGPGIAMGESLFDVGDINTNTNTGGVMGGGNPGSGQKSRSGKNKKRNDDDLEDEWGGDDLADDLLPM